MFSKLTAVAILAAATSALAQSCSTGPIQCCESVEKASDPSASKVLAGLDIVLQDLDVLVGLTCSAVSVVGVGSGNSCDAQTVCCQDNSYGGLISIGCLPITL